MHRINIIFRGLELYLKTDNQSQFTFYILQPFLFMNIMLMQFSSRFSVGREAQTSETFMSDVQQQHFNARIDLLHCFSHCTEHVVSLFVLWVLGLFGVRTSWTHRHVSRQSLNAAALPSNQNMRMRPKGK